MQAPLRLPAVLPEWILPIRPLPHRRLAVWEAQPRRKDRACRALAGKVLVLHRPYLPTMCCREPTQGPSNRAPLAKARGLAFCTIRAAVQGPRLFRALCGGGQCCFFEKACCRCAAGLFCVNRPKAEKKFVAAWPSQSGPVSLVR